VNCDITIVLFFTGSRRRHVDLDQGVDAVDADAFEDFLSRQRLEVDGQVAQAGERRVQKISVYFVQSQVAVVSNFSVG